MDTKKIPKWQVGLASLAVSAIGGLASTQSSSLDKKVYNKELKQAPWAPPAWLFAPAWNVNNYFLLSGLQQLLTMKHSAERTKLLSMQAGIWGIFFSFGYVYFKKKSPALAAAFTITDAALATASYSIARKVDKKLSYKYLPLVGWTVFASSVALYQAIKNPDPVLHTKALV